MFSRRIVVVALLLASYVAADNFDQYDTNRDGALSRQEFSDFSHNLRSAIDPFLQVEGSPSADYVPRKDGASSFASLTSGNDFLPATLNALLVILITEIGDKTFFIAAVLAMRSGRLIVYLGAMGECLLYTYIAFVLKRFVQVP